MASSIPDQSDSDGTTSTFEDLRKQDVPSDFIIKFGDESINTHQKILISHSEYFRAMLTHDTKEKQQGFVEMKNTSLDGMKQCIKFMYTGETNINDETVESILQAADMIQLLQVKEKCQKFLDENLQPISCVSTVNQSDSDGTIPTFEDLRKQDVPFDFIIKVADESITTHQKILISHSEYFRAMLTHDTKEKQEVFVEMKNVLPDGMRECIEFMYTGETNINDGTVENILQAADMIQLLKVKEKCLGYLDENLQLINCVSTLNLSSKYSCPDLQNKSQKMYDEYFDITLSELLEMSMEDFTEYYESHTITNEIAWDGILNWINYESGTRSGFVSKLVKLFDWDVFPSGILLRRLWSESLFRNFQPCRKLLFEKLFLDLEIFEANLSFENYFILKRLSCEFEYVIKQFKVTLWRFLKRNIIRLSSQKDFGLGLDSSEILFLFSEEKLEIFAPEKWWWNTAVLFVNEDPTLRTLFPALMRSIRFDRLPRFFVDAVVRNEPMVTESKQCLQILIDALYTQIIKKETEASLVLLYSDGRMRSLELESGSTSWKDLTFEGFPGQSEDIFYFNEKLCLMSGTKLFYLLNNKWIEKCSLPLYSHSKEFCTLDEFIYLTGYKKMFCYNSSKDTWNETALPDNFGTIRSIAALDGCIYAFEYRRIRKFDVEVQVWSDVSTSEETTNFAATIGKNIYTLEDYGDVKKFNQEKGLQNWKTLPASSLYERRGRSHRKVNIPCACGKFAFGLDGSRVVVVTGKKIYIFDKVFNEWLSIKDLPEYVTGTKDSQSTIEVRSACLTFKDVNYSPQPVKKQKLG